MPPLRDPNATAPIGPVKVHIDLINPEAGPTTGNISTVTNI